MTKHSAWEAVTPVREQAVIEQSAESQELEQEIRVMLGIDNGDLPGYDEDSRNAQ